MKMQSKKMTHGEQQRLTEHENDRQRLIPPVDVLENKDEIRVVTDIPGVEKDDLTIRIEDSELLIQAIQSPPSDREQWPEVEYYRTFRVPNTVDPEGINAELNQGVLTLSLKKREETKAKRIEIRVV